MSKFTDKLQTPDNQQRPISEILNDLVNIFNNEKIEKINIYISNSRNHANFVLPIGNSGLHRDLTHLLFEPLVAIRNQASRATYKLDKQRDICQEIIQLIDDHIFSDTTSSNAEHYGITIFKQALEENYNNDKISLKEKQEMLGAAGDVQSTFSKAKELSAELKNAINQSPRSTAEIAKDILKTIADSEVFEQISDYIDKSKGTFKIESHNDLRHLIFREIIAINCNADQIIKKPEKRSYYIPETIKIIDGMEYLPKTIDVRSVNKTEEHFSITLFREQLEQGFKDNKITEAERKEGHEMANDVQEIFYKLKFLGEELKNSAKQQQPQDSRAK